MPLTFLGENVVKRARFDGLLASTALVLVLALSSQAGIAQQNDNPTTASVPVPDTSLPPPLTAKDVDSPPKQVDPAPTKEEPKQNATTAPAEPAKAATNATPADPVGEKLRELVTGRQLERLVNRKADRAGIEAYYSSHNFAPIWVSNNTGNDRARQRPPIWVRLMRLAWIQPTIRHPTSSLRRPLKLSPRPSSR